MVEAVAEVTPEVAEAVTRLLPQLSSSAPVLAGEDLAAVVDSPATTLLVARLAPEKPIVGMATIVVFRIPTGVRAWLEDVVVDRTAERQGVGGALTRAAVAWATAAGARSVDLTSRPSREAANRLYQREEFVRRETNVWRYTLGS